MRTTLTLCLVALLTACGGGGDDPEPARETPASCVPLTVKIQLFGDSTQWGEMPLMHGVRATTYPEVILQGMMDARFGAGAVVVSTRAVGGTSSAQLLAGTDGLNRPWPQSVDADIVLLNHGINDSFLGVSEETYKADLLALMQAPAKVVFETPLPVSWAGYKDYAQIMRDTAAAEGVSVIDTAAFAATTSNWYGRYAQDGIHPNDAGYQLLVSGAVYPALEPMVAKLRCQ